MNAVKYLCFLPSNVYSECIFVQLGRLLGADDWDCRMTDILKGKEMKIFHPEDADVDVSCDVRCELVMSKAASTQDERLNHSEEDSSVNESLGRKAPLSSPDLTNLKHRETQKELNY